MCATVISNRNRDNSSCVEDRDFLHNTSDLMLHRASFYKELSKAFRHLLGTEARYLKLSQLSFYCINFFMTMAECLYDTGIKIAAFFRQNFT